MIYEFHGVGDSRPSLPATSTAQDALESLLDTVWRCEREWTLDDRIALAVRLAD